MAVSPPLLSVATGRGLSQGLQMDGCDICGSAGLAGPLAAGASGGFGCWAGGRLGSFPEALPECSFNLLLTSSQAVLGTRGNSEEGLLGEVEEGPIGAKGPLPSSHSRCRGQTPPSTQGSLGRLGHSPAPGISLQFSETGKRMWQQGVSAALHPTPNLPPPLLHTIWQKRAPRDGALQPTQDNLLFPRQGSR